MAHVEIDSFLTKFKLLCSAGYSATLNLESNHGRASVTLKVDIGIVSPPSPRSSNLKGAYRSPAYTRRAERRQLSRHVGSFTSGQAEQVNRTNVCDETEKPLIMNEKDIQVSDLIEAAKPEAANEAKVVTEISMVGDEVFTQEDTVQRASTSDSFSEASAESIENHGIKADNPHLVLVSSEKQETVDKVDYVAPSIDSSSLSDPSVTLVYMTALLENCPYGSVEDGVLNNIFEILSSKEQVKQNICKINVGNIFNQQSRNFKFNHRVEIILHVKTSNLREMAKRYIWRHIGTSRWNLNDGTRVSFTKIHQK